MINESFIGNTILSFYILIRKQRERGALSVLAKCSLLREALLIKGRDG